MTWEKRSLVATYRRICASERLPVCFAINKFDSRVDSAKRSREATEQARNFESAAELQPNFSASSNSTPWAHQKESLVGADQEHDDVSSEK